MALVSTEECGAKKHSRFRYVLHTYIRLLLAKWQEHGGSLKKLYMAAINITQLQEKSHIRACTCLMQFFFFFARGHIGHADKDRVAMQTCELGAINAFITRDVIALGRSCFCSGSTDFVHESNMYVRSAYACMYVHVCMYGRQKKRDCGSKAPATTASCFAYSHALILSIITRRYLAIPTTFSNPATIVLHTYHQSFAKHPSHQSAWVGYQVVGAASQGGRCLPTECPHTVGPVRAD